MSDFQLDWEQVPGVGKKKKRKREVGPTNEAAQIGLAGPHDYTSRPVVPDRTGPTSAMQVTPGVATAPGALMAQGVMSVNGTAGLNDTLEEIQTRNINLAYFRERHEVAPPDLVLSVLTNSATNNLTLAGYQSLFKGASQVAVQQYTDTHPEVTQGTIAPGKQFFQQRTQYWGPSQQPGAPNYGGGRYGRPQMNAAQIPSSAQYDVPTTNQLRWDMQNIMKRTAPRNPTAQDAANEAFPDYDLAAFSRTLADRNRNRGLPVEWNVDNPGRDPDFLYAASVYAFGRQLAPAVWGTGVDQKRANQNIDYLRSLPIDQGMLEQTARKLGVGFADWTNGQTAALVMEAMRSNNTDTVNKVVYDAWQYGRPQGEAPSLSRHEYVQKYGIDHLPLKEQEDWKRSNDSLNGMVSNLMAVPGEIATKLEDVPVLGVVAAPIAWVSGQSMKWLFAVPLEAVTHSLATIYSAAVKGSGGANTVASTSTEKRNSIIGLLNPVVGHVFETFFSDPNEVVLDDGTTAADLQAHAAIIKSASDWAANWEETQGKNAFTMYMDNYSLERFGHINPALHDLGDGANISFQFYLGAKMDAGYRELWSPTLTPEEVAAGVQQGGLKRAGFKVGRAGEAKIVDYLHARGVGKLSGFENAPAMLFKNEKPVDFVRAAGESNPVRGGEDVWREALGEEVWARQAKDKQWLKGRVEGRSDIGQAVVDSVYWNLKAASEALKRATKTGDEAKVAKAQARFDTAHEDFIKVADLSHGHTHPYAEDIVPDTVAALDAKWSKKEPGPGVTTAAPAAEPAAPAAAPEARYRIVDADGKTVQGGFISTDAAQYGIDELTRARYRGLEAPPEGHPPLGYHIEEQVPAAPVEAPRAFKPHDEVHMVGPTGKVRVGQIIRMEGDNYRIRFADAKQTELYGPGIVKDMYRLPRDMEAYHTRYTAPDQTVHDPRVQAELDTASAQAAEDAAMQNAVDEALSNWLDENNFGPDVQMEDLLPAQQLEVVHAAAKLLDPESGKPAPEPAPKSLADRVDAGETWTPVMSETYKNGKIKYPRVADIAKLDREGCANIVDSIEKEARPTKTLIAAKAAAEQRLAELNDGVEVTEGTVHPDVAPLEEPPTPAITHDIHPGDTVRYSVTNERGIPQEKTSKVVELDPGNGDLNLESGDWVNPKLATKVEEPKTESAPKADTAPVTLSPEGKRGAALINKGAAAAPEVIQADRSWAPDLQRLNDNGYKTTQSHGLPEDHPVTAASRGSEPYVEFRVAELDAIPKLRGAKIGKLKAAAKRAGMVWQKIDYPDGHSGYLFKGENFKDFTDYLLGKRPVQVKLPHTLKQWTKQVADAWGDYLTPEQVERSGALLHANAQYLDQSVEDFITARTLGVVRGNDPITVDNFTIGSAEEGGALYAKAKGDAQALETLRGKAREYINSECPDLLGDDLDVIVSWAGDQMYKHYEGMKKKGAAKAAQTLRPNTKTLFSIDISTICPFAEHPCSMCYNFQLGDWMAAYKKGAVDFRPPRSAATEFSQTVYDHDLLQMPPETVQFINQKLGGMRVNSFGDWSPEVAARFDAIYADAQKVGLDLKVITKQTDFIKQYGDKPGVSIQLSTDFNPEFLDPDAAVSVQAPSGVDIRPTSEKGLTPTQLTHRRRVLRALADKDVQRRFFSNTMLLEDAHQLVKDYQNVVIRYTAVNIREAARAGIDDRIAVLTLYHSDLANSTRLKAVLQEMWDKATPEGKKSLTQQIGEENLQAFADLHRPFMPKQLLADTFAIEKDGTLKDLTLRRREKTQAWLDDVFGEGKVNVDDWARSTYDKVCCYTKKCGSCPNKCSFAVKGGLLEDPDLVVAYMASAGDGTAMASVQFIADGRALVRALNAPGPVELAHELGHIFRRTLPVEELKLVREWAHLKPGEPWTVPAEEAFAEEFANYFGDYVNNGVLATPLKVGLMEHFVGWLRNVWANIHGTVNDKYMSDKVRMLFEHYAEPLRKGEIRPLKDEVTGAPPARPPVTVPEGTGTPGGLLRNMIFRTNAEVISRVDDPSTIGFMYDLSETNSEQMKLCELLAKAQTPEQVEPLLHQLRTHGVDIDGGAGAILKNMRQAAYRKGFGQRNFLRFFITPTTYGRTQPIEGSTEAVFNYMVASKMGAQHAVSPELWQQMRRLRLELWRESNPLKKRLIVGKIDDIIEGNIKKWDPELEGLTQFTRRYYRAQGRTIMSGVRRAYYGSWEVVDGEMRPVEKSRVTSRTNAKAFASEQVKKAQLQLDELAPDIAPERRKLVEAKLKQAEGELASVVQACDDVEVLGLAKNLTKDDVKRLNRAHNVLANYGTPVPVKMGQAANKIVFRHNPRILAAYVTGPNGQALALADQAVFQPLMTLFKETVMSSMGFPIRVNIGDEYIRLIPEGTIARLRGQILRRHPIEGLKNDPMVKGLWNDEIEQTLHDKLAYDWVASDSGDWILVTPQTHPKYFDYYASDLRSWANEPIVKRLVEANGGVFPEHGQVGDIKSFIGKILDEDTDLSKELKRYLEDTYRMEKGVVDPVAFKEWTKLWQDRLETISTNKTLRDAMVRAVDPAELKRNVPQELLWPVNAPEQLFIGSRPNLGYINYANPFHYIYQGIPMPFAASRRYGSVQLLGVMSNWLRETIFSDRYYIERDAELARAPHLAETQKGLEELHNTAAKRSMDYTNKVTYSRSSTMFEDMTRNLIPFGNAYRQFWQYWIATFAKHPFAMSVWMKNYQTLEQDVAGVAGGASKAVGGPNISMNGQFLSIGDYQAYMPAIPFLAVQDENSKGGPLGVVTSNLPQASFLITVPAKTLIGALNGTAEDYSGLPMLGGLASSYVPFSRQARLLYGVTGITVPEAPGNGIFAGAMNDTIEGLFGDPSKLRKASINALLGQLHYSDADGLHRHDPWWWIGVGAHPEAIFAEVMKQLPNPATVSYSPEMVRNKGNWLFSYYDAQRKGQTLAAAQLRADHPWLDRYLAFYDASEEERVAMKVDPNNKEMLMWWVSPYNYDTSGAPLEGKSWQDQFAAGRVTYKKEDEYVAAIHNLYVDVWGGTYQQSSYRQGGVSYRGDIDREAAKKVATKKIKTALEWANHICDIGAKERGWDKAFLMYKFMHPDRDWGMWPQILELNGLDPAQYNVKLIETTFFKRYQETMPQTAGPLEALNSHPYGKVYPHNLSTEDGLRALDLAKFIPDPKLQKEFLEQTPYADVVKQSRRDQINTMTKAVVEDCGTENWYFFGSQQLKLLGVPASPKLDLAMNDLHTDYVAWHKLTSGSSEYKDARVAYYKERDRVLSNIPGGKLIMGGIASRLLAMPFVLDANVTTMGTGKAAPRKQANYELFLATVKKELAKTNPDPQVLNDAWDKVKWNEYEAKQQTEAKRAAAWAYLIAEGKKRRQMLLTHYSDYYQAKGDSAASKYGTAQKAALDKVIAGLRKFSPEFSHELNNWFGQLSPSNAFIDWYNY